MPMYEPMLLGSVRVDPPLVLAPLAGTTLRPFRLLCRRLGAGMVCGEMISGMALRYANERTGRMLAVDPDEHPVSLQIAAGRPEVAGESATALRRAGADVIDLNMGCPVPKVRKTGAGAILGRDPGLARAIMDATVEAAAGIPVTVKMRAGWDDDSINFMRIADEAVASGCAGIALHARTAVQMYAGRAEWGWIRQLVSHVPVPVTGNGDVRGPEDCLRMLEETGCAAVMIGREAQANPWVFQRCAAALAGAAVPPPPDWSERLAAAQSLCEGLIEELGERRGCLYARRTLGWLSRGMPDGARFRSRAHRISSAGDLRALLDAYGVPSAS